MAQAKGITEIVANIKKYEARSERRIKIAIDMTQSQVVTEARTNHPYQDHTENLTNSIQKIPIQVERGSIVGQVEAYMPYASKVEGGTSRSRAYPFLAPAVLKNERFFVRQIAKALR